MKDIKELDENTAITLYLINTMIKKGELTKINYGNAQLVNIDEIADFQINGSTREVGDCHAASGSQTA